MPQRPPSHRPTKNTTTTTAQPVGYQRDPISAAVHSSRRWTKLSNHLRTIHPLCASGLHDGVIPPAKQVHHILPIITHQHLAYQWDNLIPLCGDCHKKLEGNKNLVSPFINYKETSSNT